MFNIRSVLVAVLVVIGLGAAAAACGDGGPNEAAPESSDSVTLRGTLSLDGAPFDAQFLGARVLRDGLVTACQETIPPVDDGTYQIGVVADAEVNGCGVPGAEIFLWTYVDDRWLYSLETAAWPGAGRATTFDATFSTSAPEGVAPRTTDIAGEIRTSDGDAPPPGTRVEAYVGDVLCAVASVRAGTGSTPSSWGFVLAVVGSDSVAGCDEGATLTFRVDGEAALETAVHDFVGTHLNLTLP